MKVPELAADLGQLVAVQGDLPVLAAGIVHVQNPLGMANATGTFSAAFGVEGLAMNQGAAEDVAEIGGPGDLAAGDAAFYSIAGEKAAQEPGVTHVVVPNRKTRSVERRKLEKQRWFKQGQKWRTGCEGRISVLKRRHGLNRCRYKGDLGMRRWVGLGVIGDTLINISCALLPKD